jgi:hypothetical protein
MANTERIERTFSVGDACQLEVSNISGSIRVVGKQGEQVHVVALKRWRGQREDEATTIDMGQEGSRVWVRTQTPGESRWPSWRPRRKAASVDYQIEVPHTSQISLSSVSATTSVSTIEGHVGIKTISGSVSIEDITGSIHVHSVSGSIHGHGLQGPLHVETVSGRADTTASDFTSIAATTVSGRLRFATSLQPAGTFDVHTVSGDVELVVPPDTHCTIEGRSISGELRTALHHTCERRGAGTWRVRVGDGGPLLHFDSVSADLILTPADPETTAEQAVPDGDTALPQAAPQASSTAPAYSTSMDILRAIEAGQLSVEEGVVQLRKIQDKGGDLTW